MEVFKLSYAIRKLIAKLTGAEIKDGKGVNGGKHLPSAKEVEQSAAMQANLVIIKDNRGYLTFLLYLSLMAFLGMVVWGLNILHIWPLYLLGMLIFCIGMIFGLEIIDTIICPDKHQGDSR